MNCFLYQHGLLSLRQQTPSLISHTSLRAILVPITLKSRLIPGPQETPPGFNHNHFPQPIPGGQPAPNGGNSSHIIHSGSHAINVAYSHLSMVSVRLVNSLACLGSIPMRSPRFWRSFVNKI